MHSIEEDNSNEERQGEQTNIRQSLDKFFSINNRRYKLIFASSLLTIFTSLLYVLMTYWSKAELMLEIFDYFVCLFYLMEYVIMFILEQHRVAFFFSRTTFYYFIIIVPPFLIGAFRDDDDSVAKDFINFTRILRFLKLFKGISRMTDEINDVWKQISIILTTIAMIIFVFSGTVQLSERREVERRIAQETDPYTRFLLENRTEFHHYIYFIIVTISTVGYGEIFPYTLIGKLVVTIVVFVTLILIPKQTNDLVQLLDSKSKYARSSYKGSRDVFN